MGIIQIAVDKVGSDSALQRELVRVGIDVSVQAIWAARTKGKESLRLDVLAGIVRVAFGGDWSKAGKVIEGQFLE